MLTATSEVSAASWFLGADASWWDKACLGVPGFDAYAQVFYDMAEDAPDDAAHLLMVELLRVLGRHTARGTRTWFGQWEGCGWYPPTQPDPALAHLLDDGSAWPMRSYHLFTGDLEDVLAWHDQDWPHLTWPDDHAWFLAADVDPDWIGIGGSRALVDDLLTSALDARESTYDARDWETS